jgi:hypothetical protein
MKLSFVGGDENGNEEKKERKISIKILGQNEDIKWPFVVCRMWIV